MKRGPHNNWGWGDRPAPTKLEGDDFQAYANAVAAKLEHEALTQEGREREALAQRHFAGGTYFLAVRRIIGAAHPVEVETCEVLPIVGRMRATGRDYDKAVSNLWMGIAHRLLALQVVEEWEDARGIAVEKYAFLPSMGDIVR